MQVNSIHSEMFFFIFGFLFGLKCEEKAPRPPPKGGEDHEALNLSNFAPPLGGRGACLLA